MKTRFAAVIAAIVAATPSVRADTLPSPCFMVDPDKMVAELKQAGVPALDVLGDIRKAGRGCEMNLLTTDGVYDVTFEIRFVQGKEYFHKLSQRFVTDFPREDR